MSSMDEKFHTLKVIFPCLNLCILTGVRSMNQVGCHECLTLIYGK